MSRRAILIVDDDRNFAEALRRFFDREPYQVSTAYTAAEGLARCREKVFDVVLLDQRLPDGEGARLCPAILEHNEHAQIVLVTAQPTFESAVAALKAGAVDYLSKPIELPELEHVVAQCLRTLALERIGALHGYEARRLSHEAERLAGMAEITRTLDLAAASDATVLITGETGTGKNVLSRYVHYHSQRRDGPYVVVNCAALPEALVEGELFGHQKGAFTGAVESRKGLFELATGGSIVLDELGELPVGMQAKLLRVLDERKVRRLGAESEREIDLRVIAISNVDLEAAVKDGRFRSDLYYRLSVVRVHVPPLRERRQDIPDLVRRFVDELSPSRSRSVLPAAMDRLVAYDWPGNVRELRNVIERSLLLQPGEHIDPSRLLAPGSAESVARAQSEDSDDRTLDQVERDHILRTWHRLGENTTRAARALGISLATLKRKLKTYRVADGR